MSIIEPNLPENDTAERTGPPTVPARGAGDASTRITRASAAWVGTGAALVLLVLLIVFVLQNQSKVEIRFFGFDGTIPLGMAMLIAAVAGGVVVSISGVARVVQLRRAVRRNRRAVGDPAD